MKKTLSIISIIAFIILLSSCDIDPYANKRPIDYPNSTWECTNKTITFSVDKNGNAINGILKSNNEEISIDFLWASFRPTVNVFRFDDVDRNTLFKAECQFSKKKFTMYISNSNGYLTQDNTTLECTRK